MRPSKLLPALALCLGLNGPAAAQSPPPQQPATVAPIPFDIPYGAPITLDLAQRAVAAALTEASGRNWKMAITIVDPSGNLIAHVTMDGTQFGSIPIAQAKARTATLLRRPSQLLADAVNAGSSATLSLLALFGGAASEGGLPILLNERIIGAIGVSGGTTPQDAVIAKAGLDAITAR